MILDLYQLIRKVKNNNNIEVYEGICLIRNQKKNVYIKRSLDQKYIMRDIMIQLLFYENEINFNKIGILKMRDYFNVKDYYHVIYDTPGDTYTSIDIIKNTSESFVMTLIYDLYNTIDSIHSNGLVHNKINTESILFCRYNTIDMHRLIITDFDRCIYKHHKPHTIEVDCFSSPELILNTSNIDRMSDYWSISCIIFYILTKQNLFPTTSRSGIVYMV